MSTMSQRLAAHADAHISPPTPPTPSTPSDELDLEVESTSEGVDVGRDAPLSVEAQVLPAETHPRCLHKAILKSPSMRPNKGQAGWGNLPAELIK
jgi:hypothetical protein